MAKFKFSFVSGEVVEGGNGVGRPLIKSGCIREAREGFVEAKGHAGVFYPATAVQKPVKAPTAMYTIAVDGSLQSDGNRKAGKPKKGYVLQKDSLVVDGIELKGSVVRREQATAPVAATV